LEIAEQKEALNHYVSLAKEFTQKKASRYRQLTKAEQSANRHKSKIRSTVEHVFGVMKRQCGFAKDRNGGLIRMLTVYLPNVPW
jgi:IS5 family transposase